MRTLFLRLLLKTEPPLAVAIREAQRSARTFIDLEYRSGPGKRTRDLSLCRTSRALPTEVILPRLRTIGHFRVPPGLGIKTRLSAQPLKCFFHSHANKTHLHKKGCALSLTLKVRDLFEVGINFFNLMYAGELWALRHWSENELGTFLSRIYEAVARIENN